MHQRDEVGSSAVGDLARIEDKMLVHKCPERVELMRKIRDMVKHFECDPSNRKNMIWFHRNIGIFQSIRLRKIILEQESVLCTIL